MDTTMDTHNAMRAQQARNDALTAADLEAATKEGAEAAASAIARGENVWLMGEASFDERQNAYAMGWNSQYGSEENQRLWTAARSALVE